MTFRKRRDVSAFAGDGVAAFPVRREDVPRRQKEIAVTLFATGTIDDGEPRRQDDEQRVGKNGEGTRRSEER